MSSQRKILEWTHWGRIRYVPALERQVERWQAVLDRKAPQAIFTLEHDPVITLGRRGDAADLLVPKDHLEARGFEVVEVDRGGEVTYHGPGQLTVYAIVDCKRMGIGPGDLVRALAGSISEELAEYGIEAPYDGDHPGLWTEGAKITAVGMRIKQGVSLHGAALNVSTNLEAFTLFVPCGMPEAQATSMADQGVVPPELEVLGGRIAQKFAVEMGMKLVPAPV